jgi:hypothetical protein
MARPKGTAGGEKINKRQAVREAMDLLGMDAGPGQIQDELRKKGIDMSTNMISSYKSQIRSKLGMKGRRRRKGRRAKAAAAEVAVTPPRPATGDVSLKDLRAFKEMAQRVGVPRMRDLFEILYQ